MTTVQLVGGIEKRDLVLADYDTRWPEKYTEHERCIHAALGTAAVQVDHIGSTSVPGLAAKPIIDIQVIVEDITVEEVYLDQLLDSGYELRVREPAHRMVRTPDRDVHVHIHEVGDQAATDHHHPLELAGRSLSASPLGRLSATVSCSTPPTRWRGIRTTTPRTCGSFIPRAPRCTS